MAIIRKKVTAPIDVVLLHDPAIDPVHSDMGAYIETFDIKHLVFHEGQKPTIFKLKQLTEKQKDFLEQFSDETQSRIKAKWTIRFALVNFENLSVDEDGQIVPVEPIAFQKVRGVPGTVVKESWVDNAGLGTEEIAALRLAVVLHSEVMSPLSEQSLGRFGNSTSMETRQFA